MNKIICLLAVLVTFLSGCGGGGSATQNQSSQTNVNTPDDCYFASYKIGEVKYPSEYIGKYTLPTPTRTLPASITRAMNLKDVDINWVKPNTSKCSDANQFRLNSAKESLHRLQQLGVSEVEIYNYAPWDDIKADVLTISELSYVLPKTVLKSIVEEAHKRNIKVSYVYQWNACDLKSSCFSDSDINVSTLNKILDAFNRQIVSDAAYGESIGLDSIKGQLDAIMPKRLPIYKENEMQVRNLWINKTTSTLDEIRKVFKGKISYGTYDAIWDKEIFSKIDSLKIKIFTGNLSSKVEFTTSFWRDYSRDNISNYEYWIKSESGLDQITTPIDWEIYISSSIDFYTSIWNDDYCTLTMISNNQCPQEKYATDFSAQAIVGDAILYSIAEQNKFNTRSVAFDGYAHTDNITPYLVSGGGAYYYPNWNLSIRNKSLEPIVKTWFAK